MLNLCKRSFWSSSLCLLDNCGFSYLKILDVPIRVSRSLEIYRSNVSFLLHASIFRKKRDSRIPGPAFFRQNLETLKIRKNTPKVKFVEKFQKVKNILQNSLKIYFKNTEKYWWLVGQICKIRKNTQNLEEYSGNPEKYRWDLKGPHSILVGISEKMLKMHHS